MAEPTIPRRLVVAGLILDGEGRVLITQRRADKTLPLLWEFPGGKIEPRESPEQALRRELFEELGVRVRVGRIWDALTHDYGDYEVLMLVYPCVVEPGHEPRCVEVRALAWKAPAELFEQDLLPADIPIAERLHREDLPIIGPGEPGPTRSPC